MVITMAKFSKQDLQTELASALIVIGRQIELWSDDLKLATDFLSCGHETLALDLRPDDIDVRRFPMAQRILKAYDYAFAPTADDAPDLDGLHELADMLAGLPREDFSGNISAFPSIGNESKIRDVCEAVWARAAIDGIDDGLTTELSIRQLALLADMTEGAVRNAMTLSGETGLAAIPKSKPVRFDVDEARRWLSGRRGFVRTPSGPTNDPILNERLRMFERMEQLTDFIDRHAQRVFGSFRELVRAVGLEDEARAATWLDGTYQFDRETACALGSALGADASTFAGKTLELSLRRDFGKGGTK